MTLHEIVMTVLKWWGGMGFMGSILWNYGERDMMWDRGIYTGTVFWAVLWRVFYPIILGPMGLLIGALMGGELFQDSWYWLARKLKK